MYIYVYINIYLCIFIRKYTNIHTRVYVNFFTCICIIKCVMKKCYILWVHKYLTTGLTDTSVVNSGHKDGPFDRVEFSSDCVSIVCLDKIYNNMVKCLSILSLKH